MDSVPDDSAEFWGAWEAC